MPTQTMGGPAHELLSTAESHSPPLGRGAELRSARYPMHFKLQWSLRTILLLMLVVGVSVAPLGRELYLDQSDAKLAEVAKIHTNGTLVFVTERRNLIRWVWGLAPRHKCVGAHLGLADAPVTWPPDNTGRVLSVQMVQCGNKDGTTDQSLEAISHFDELRDLQLYLGAARITPDGLAFLRSLQNLERFDCVLPFTAADAHLAALEGTRVTRLRVLGNGGVRCETADFSRLWELRELTIRLNVTQTAAECLASAPRLESLHVIASEVTSDGLCALCKNPALRSLSLAGLPVGDALASCLAQASGLESLNLQGTRITDAGVQELSALLSLQDLDLGRTLTTDDGLRKLHVLVNLRALRLAETKLSDDALGAFRPLSHLEELVVSNTQVTIQGFEPLRGIGLRSIWAWHLDRGDANRLAAAFPGAKVWGQQRPGESP